MKWCTCCGKFPATVKVNNQEPELCRGCAEEALGLRP